MSDMQTLIDAIVTDVEAECDLPKHYRWLYAQPLGVPPDFTPCLAVYVSDQTFDPFTTDTLEGNDEIRVGWIVDASAQAETLGVGQQELSAAQFEVTQRILARLATYKVGVPGLVEVREATLTKSTYRALDRGMLWRFEAHLDVTDYQ